VPEWEKLAAKTKGLLKVAYWDTTAGRPPPLLGEVKGTPTIKAFVPKRKDNKNNREKNVHVFNGERKAKSVYDFATRLIPSAVERIKKGSLDEFNAKAKKFGLPKVFIFTKKSATSPLIKALSIEFRRKLLIAVVPTGSRANGLLAEFGLQESKLPVILVLKEDGEPIRFLKKTTYNRLNNFFHEHALKYAVGSKKWRDAKRKANQADEL